MQHTNHEVRSNGQSPTTNGAAVSVYEWVSDTARNNPALVVGGAVAIGALTALALTRREPPKSNMRVLERRLRRQLASAESALKRGVRDLRRADIGSSLSEVPAAFASRLGNMDMSQLETLAHHAGRMLDRISARITGAGR